MKNRLIAIALLAFAAACAGPSPMGTVRDTCANCGTVRGVDVINEEPRTTGAGALMGAVMGGVVGHQFGSGKGQDAATAAGAVGGAYAGNEVEKGRAASSYYRITIDMDRGNTETVNVANPAGLRPGNRVKVIGNNIEYVR
jgi:outer membrane lipoprotein SlyB